MPGHLEPLLTVVRGQHLVAGLPQLEREDLHDVRLVVHNKNPGGSGIRLCVVEMLEKLVNNSYQVFLLFFALNLAKRIS